MLVHDELSSIAGAILNGCASATEDAFVTVVGPGDAPPADAVATVDDVDDFGGFAAAACPAALIVFTTAGEDDDVLAPDPKALAIAATPVGPLGLAGAAGAFDVVAATPDAALAAVLAVATDVLAVDEDAAAPAAFVATLPSDILSSKYHVLKSAGLLADTRKNAVLFLRRNYLVKMISSSCNTCDYAG